MVPYRLLQGFEVFNGLTDDELKLVANLGREESFEEDQVIFSEESPAETFYCVLEGRVAIRFRLLTRPITRETTIDTVRKGEVFGWSALVRPYRLTASAICAERTRCITFSGAELRQLFQENCHIGYVVMENLAEVIASRLRDVRLQLIREVGLSLIHGW